MTNHLKSFYPDDEKVKKEIFSPASSQDSPAELEKRLQLLTKKLHSYEKRKQKLLIDQVQSKEEQSPITSSNANDSAISSNQAQESSLTKNNSNPNLASQFNISQTSSQTSQITPVSSHLLTNPSSSSQLQSLSKFNLNNRNGSFNGNNPNISQISKTNPNEDVKSTLTNEEKSLFYLNLDGAKLTPNPVPNNFNYGTNNGTNVNEIFSSSEEQMENNAALLAANRSLHNLVYLSFL